MRSLFSMLVLIVAGLFLNLTVLKTVSAGNDKPGSEMRYPLIELGEVGSLSLQVGQNHTFKATYFETKGQEKLVEFKWTVIPAILGTISEKGEFTAQYAGFGEIIVESGSAYSKVKIRVYHSKEDNKTKLPYFKIVSKPAGLKVGQFVEMMAVVYESSVERKTVEAQWLVAPDSLGYFEGNVFHASTQGKGYLFAKYESYMDSIPVKIVASNAGIHTKDSIQRLIILPDDTTIRVGQSVNYRLAYPDGKPYQEEFTWQLTGNKVGTISREGVLTTTRPGVAVVKAIVKGKPSASTRVMVSKDTLSDVNTVKFFRVLANGNILPEKRIKEGSTYKFTGFPYPLNILNGGLLHFPTGSLKEDISIYMMLPEQVKETEGEDEVGFADSIFSGVKFVVVVDSVPVEPYQFEIPLHLSLRYKKELLDSLGLSPNQVGMFFSQNGDYISSGITGVTVDSVSNRIIAQVEHFSTLVLRIDKSVAAKKEMLKMTGIKNMTAYPNPFSHEILIRYNADDTEEKILTIYNQIGQIVNKIQVCPISTGNNIFTWDGNDALEKPVERGLYFGVLTSGESAVQLCKMVKR